MNRHSSKENRQLNRYDSSQQITTTAAYTSSALEDKTHLESVCTLQVAYPSKAWQTLVTVVEVAALFAQQPVVLGICVMRYRSYLVGTQCLSWFTWSLSWYSHKLCTLKATELKFGRLSLICSLFPYTHAHTLAHTHTHTHTYTHTHNALLALTLFYSPCLLFSHINRASDLTK